MTNTSCKYNSLYKTTNETVYRCKLCSYFEMTEQKLRYHILNTHYVSEAHIKEFDGEY